MASKGNNRANITACQRVLTSDMRSYGIIELEIDSVALFLLECAPMLTGDMRRGGTFNQEVMGSNPIALTNEIKELDRIN
jgi:hypothetical protein